MEYAINYFETIPSWHRSLLLIGGIAFFWMLENGWPARRLNYRKNKHAGLNFFFTATTILVNFSLAGLLLWLSDWTQSNQWGVLSLLSGIPLWGQVFVGVALLDLIGAYFAHWSEHKIKVLWGFHLIHHTDHEVDTTTANRHHPMESVVRFGFTLMAVWVTGASVGIIMLYQSLSVVLSQFNHANILLPKQLNQWVQWFLVTPNMHQIHHHHQLPYTDANYGNIFSIWDRIFGTYQYLPADQVVFGVDTYPDAAKNSEVKHLLALAFKPYKSPPQH
jgi:sterol desaturase/sphingolipid hydroxylase (fatty acid hydroxylase superfamily)